MKQWLISIEYSIYLFKQKNEGENKVEFKPKKGVIIKLRKLHAIYNQSLTTHC